MQVSGTLYHVTDVLNQGVKYSIEASSSINSKYRRGNDT